MNRTIPMFATVALLSVASAGTVRAQATTTADSTKAAKRATKRAEKTEEKAEGKEAHPHIAIAIKELEATKKELQTAAHDFGGHRVDAIKAIDEALKQLRLAQQFDKK